MPNISFTHGNVTITVRESIGSDIFDEDLIFGWLGTAVNGHPKYRVDRYVDAVVRSTVTVDAPPAVEGEEPKPIVSDLGFEWPTSVVDAQRAKAGYEPWRKLPRELLKKWDKALSDANEGPGDPDLHGVSEGKPLPPSPSQNA